MTSPGAVIACATLAKPSFEPSVATTWVSGIELHAEPAAVIGGLGAAQAGDALRGRIAVGARLAECVLELLDHMGGRRQVGIAHAEIDDVGAGIACCGLGAVDLLEDVGRQTPDAMKLFHDPGSCGLRGRCSARAGAGLLSQSGRPPGLVARGGAGARGDEVVFELLLLGVREHGGAARGRQVVDRRIGGRVRRALGAPSGRPPAAVGSMVGDHGAGRAACQSDGRENKRRRREDGSRENPCAPAISTSCRVNPAGTTPSAARPSHSEAKLLPVQAIARSCRPPI